MDKKTQQEAIITSAAVVILIIILFVNLKGAKKKMSAPKPAAAPSAPAPAAVLSAPAAEEKKAAALSTPEEIEEQKKRAALDWGTDPFYHVAETDVYRGVKFILKGVSIGEDRKSYAFINDEIVGAGDLIFGYTVKEVQRNKVLLQKGEENFYLVLPEERFKEK